MRPLNVILGGILLLCLGCAHQEAERVEVLGSVSTPEEVYAHGDLVLESKTPATLTQGSITVLCTLTNVSKDPIHLPLWFKDGTQPNFFVWMKRETDGQQFYCVPTFMQNNATFVGTNVKPGEVRVLRGEFVLFAPPGQYLMLCKLVSCRDVYSNGARVEIVSGANLQKPSKSL